MPKQWKWKAIIVLLATVIGIYILIPTIFQMDKKREVWEANGQAIPWYIGLFPKKALNLGLDLQGGIYIEMEVDIPSAIKRKLDLTATDVEAALKDEDIPYENVTQPKGSEQLYIRAKTVADREQIGHLIDSDFRGIFAIHDTTTDNGMPTVVVGFNDKYKNYFSTKVVEQALETIRNRIDRFGVAEPSIIKMGEDRIAIELPGMSDPERAINLIKKTGQLEFKIVDESISEGQLAILVNKVRTSSNLPDNYSTTTVNNINDLLKNKIPENSEVAFELVRDQVTRKVIKGVPYLLKLKAEVTGDMLQNAMVSIRDNEPYVDLTLDKRGTKLFADLTSNNVGKKLAIVLDGNVMKAPVIKEAIPHGRAQITLGFGNYQEILKEAEDLTLVLQEGALPATMHEATKTVIGPTLGRDSIRQGIHASLLAAAAVFLFMIIYYKLSGVWANIALVINVILLLAILSLFQATLTLPGIAGIVLTIGIAVDANVIINERIREEIALGRTPKTAVDNGYSNALSAVFDANITTLIAGIILYQFGTGSIRGFAVTLSIGIVTTLFTAIIITRLIYDYRAIKGRETKISI